jgi:hypothetical protein
MRRRYRETAAERMRNLAAPGRYRVEPDAEGVPTIPRGLGRIGWHDPDSPELAVYTDRPRLFARFWPPLAWGDTRPATRSSAPSSLPRCSRRSLA